MSSSLPWNRCRPKRFTWLNRILSNSSLMSCSCFWSVEYSSCSLANVVAYDCNCLVKSSSLHFFTSGGVKWRMVGGLCLWCSGMSKGKAKLQQMTEHCQIYKYWCDYKMYTCSEYSYQEGIITLLLTNSQKANTISPVMLLVKTLELLVMSFPFIFKM